jgi:uncharacterized membrane protein
MRYYMIDGFAKTFIASLIVIIVIDIPVISQIMHPLWEKMVYNIQQNPIVVNKQYAMVAYMLLALSLSIFSIPNIRNTHVLSDSIYYGGMLGIVIYGVFDFTNLAIFKNYNLYVGLIDTLWGGLLLASCSYIVKRGINPISFNLLAKSSIT